RIDQRPTAEAARYDHIDALKRPDIEQPVDAFAGVPEVGSHMVWAARKRAGRVDLAALEQADAPASLGKPVGHRRPAEARADDHRVKMVFDRFARRGCVCHSYLTLLECSFGRRIVWE